jgi:hypothetical protein
VSKKKVVEKYNLDDAEDLWGSVLSEESSDDDDDDLFGLDDFLSDDEVDDVLDNEQDSDSYDDLLENDDISDDETFFDDESVDEQIVDDDSDSESEQISEEAAPETSEPVVSSAILEFIGGLKQEVAHVRLFEPLENSILVIDEETNDEQVVFFDQLICLRISCLPAGISDKRKESCIKEIIETVDGTIFNELVSREQNLDDLLICISSDDQTPYRFTLFPNSIIKKRTQDRQLTDILLEKRFVSKMMLRKALQEYEQVKSMTLEKIIAQKARVPLAKIEEVLEQAQQNQMQGLQKEEVLLFSGLVSDGDILDAVDRLEYIDKLTLDQFLVEKRVVKEREVYISLAEKNKIPFVDLIGRKLSKKSLASIPKSMILKHEILPLVMKDDMLLVATHCIDMTHLSEEIVKAADCKDVKFILSPPTDIRKIIHLIYDKKK